MQSPVAAAITPRIFSEQGVVDVKSKLHFAADLGPSHDRARWNPIDWLLGTKKGQFVGLFLVAILINVFGALIWMTTEGNEIYDTSWWSSLWFSWGMFFDPGTQMGFAPGEPHTDKLVAVTFSITGFLYNLVFLGLIVETVRNLLEHWRKSRSRIVANDHTLILGWSRRSLFLIAQLLQSMENRGVDSELVILAEEDEYSVKQELKRQFPDMDLGSRVRFRSGSPTECDDLMHVSAYSAREIIILSQPGSQWEVDLDTVRGVISVAALPKQPKCPVIAEVRAPETSHAIRHVLETAEGIYVKHAVRRVLCLTAIQPAVGDTFQTLMSWLEGCEIYVKSREDLGVPQVTTVGQAQEALDKGIIVGVRPQDHHCIMAPPASRELEPTDKLLVIADSLTDICFSASSTFAISKALRSKSCVDVPSNTKALSVADVSRSVDAMSNQRIVIIVGWPNDIDDVLIVLEDYLAPGSEVHILALMSEAERKSRLDRSRVLRNTQLTIRHVEGNITNVYTLAELPLDKACAVLVLADDALDEHPRKADSASLQAAINIDSLLKGHYEDQMIFKKVEDSARPRIVCEILSADTERALKFRADSNDNGAGIQFFHSGVMETGLFTMAPSQLPVFNAMVMMLRPNDYGDLMTLPMASYINDPGLAARPELPLIECFDLVRKAGDILIGVVPERGGSVTINPCRREAPPVAQGSHVVVVSKRMVKMWSQKLMLRRSPSSPMAGASAARERSQLPSSI